MATHLRRHPRSPPKPQVQFPFHSPSNPSISQFLASHPIIPTVHPPSVPAQPQSFLTPASPPASPKHPLLTSLVSQCSYFTLLLDLPPALPALLPPLSSHPSLSSPPIHSPPVSRQVERGRNKVGAASRGHLRQGRGGSLETLRQDTTAALSPPPSCPKHVLGQLWASLMCGLAGTSPGLDVSFRGRKVGVVEVCLGEL
ncbi:uncharacterized protein LOC135090801 [Scylla paramamosain]|uniref:uncharacterized protein LOC135090801 n=1 Tax=Scylla paramamosain TaxID=85552 RepID=UPI00308397AB